MVPASLIALFLASIGESFSASSFLCNSPHQTLYDGPSARSQQKLLVYWDHITQKR
jgi:hypothetical protein